MKKLLSIILTAAMLLSLIPSVFAEGETTEETTTYVYNFKMDKNDPRRVKAISDKVYFAKYKTEYPSDETATWTTANTDNWKYFAMSDGLAAVTQAYDVAGIGSQGVQMRTNKVDVSKGSQWIAIKIRIPETGVYNVKYTIITNSLSYCSDAFISFLPGDYASGELTYDVCKDKNIGIVNDGIKYKVTDADAEPVEKTVTDNVLVATENNQEFLFIMGNNNAEKGYMVVNNITLTKTDESVDENTYETEAGVNLNPTVKAAAYAKGTTLSPTTLSATKNGDVYEVKTDATIGDYTFRYWVRGLEDASKGNKRIVSLENNFTYSAEKGDVNYLIAVYAKDGEAGETEYFNANGQLIPDATDETKPYMLGYGEATGWKDNGNGIKEAVFENGVQSYNITVNGKTDTYEYGKEITCPKVTPEEGKYFWGWTKTAEGSEKAELVSTDMNYTFYAWENCTVEPLFGNSKALFGSDLHKIILSSLDIGNNESVIKAEFIGFEDAVERGITLGSKDYAMTRNYATQFAIINDVEVADANISAYAILADGMKYIYNLIKSN